MPRVSRTYRRLNVVCGAGDLAHIKITRDEFRDAMFARFDGANAWINIEAVDAGRFLTVDEQDGTATVWWNDAVQGIEA